MEKIIQVSDCCGTEGSNISMILNECECCGELCIYKDVVVNKNPLDKYYFLKNDDWLNQNTKDPNQIKLF